MIRIDIPPSVNGMFFTKKNGQRAKSKSYAAWIMKAGYQLLMQQPPKFTGDVVVNIRIGPRIKNSDVDNRIKGVLDLLTKMRVIVDDRFVVSVLAAWDENARGCEVTVRAA